MDEASHRLSARNLPALCLAAPILLALSSQFTRAKPGPVAAAPPRPALAFDQYLVDLGEVPPSEEVDAHFAFTNCGAAPVLVNELVPSCGCLQPQLAKKAYKPGESGRFRVRVQTANENAGLKEYQIVVKYTDPEPREAVLTFRVVLPENKVFIRPRALLVYQQRSSESTVREIEIIDRRSRHLNISRAECSKKFIHVAVLGSDADESGSWRGRIEVTIPGNLPPRRIEALVRVLTDDRDYPILRIPLIIDGGTRKIVDRHIEPASGTR